MTRILVTGGAGFIGLNFVEAQLEADANSEIVVLDKLTYASNAAAISPRCNLVKADITDREAIRDVLSTYRPSLVIHFAAETHVDRSIAGPDAFVSTNVVGTFALLEECRAYLETQPDFRLIHVSTDEVFGELGPEGSFVETSRYAPRSPYAATKAASDHLVRAYIHTYGLPAIVTNCSNNYGPYQFPEKLIPLVVTRALANQALPVYGAGANVRDWIHVADHCAAIREIAARGTVGETYLIGARNERTNLEVVHAICSALDRIRPRTRPYSDLVEHVTDRAGHDFRYAIDPTKLERELGWRPRIAFDIGLQQTVEWYVSRESTRRSPRDTSAL